ncbi:DUF4238 domain-containing protein [Kineosporia sp. NBRC 101731]|uniref:DUF4238 domain-containing protein n=1 Tax=Kineosporia sp. NBRC 101731 TaxID=3032199 RepID=UPI0025551A13|nr:DUF4238 domain-containing protein [Kineosporia sp. NBRC 101731]
MSAEPLRRRQHLVSKGYQANFADGKFLTILDSLTGNIVETRRSIESNWRKTDFLTVQPTDGNANDSLERRFSRDEKKVLNQIRLIEKPTISDQQRASLDLLAAIHLVRSESYAVRHEQVSREYLENCVPEFMSHPEIEHRFLASNGRQPNDDELESLIAQQARKLLNSPDLLANSIRHGRRSLPNLFSQWKVQLVTSPPHLPGFVLADQPVVHAQRYKNRFGFKAGLAVGDADLVMAPIHRRLLACYTHKALFNATLSTKQRWSMVNAALCRNALTEVACHPDDAREVKSLIRNIDRYPASKL